MPRLADLLNKYYKADAIPQEPFPAVKLKRRRVLKEGPVVVPDKVVIETPPVQRLRDASLRVIRDKVRDYYENPKKYMDFDSLCHSHGDTYMVSVKSFEEVTGLNKIGSGAYAKVYDLDDARVLKIIRTSDSGYARFVEIIKKYPNNPHFPKVHYSGNWGGKQVYVLERLEEVGSRQLFGHFYDALFAKMGDNPFITTTYATKQLQQAADILREFDLGGDLHYNNVMKRSDGTLVITDPVAE